MQQMKSLAPTIIDALNAVEQGCRQIQNDDHFKIDNGYWLYIKDNISCGCLATITLMQLTNQTGQTLLPHFVPGENSFIQTNEASRANAYGIDVNDEKKFEEFSLFETVINNLRYKFITELLDYYNLKDHENAHEAIQWVLLNQPAEIRIHPNKTALLNYADFLRDELIPRMKNWFPANY